MAGDFKGALAIQDKLVHLHRNLFLEPNPTGVKYAGSRLGLCENELRLPLVPVSQPTQEALDFALRHAGLI